MGLATCRVCGQYNNDIARPMCATCVERYGECAVCGGKTTVADVQDAAGRGDTEALCCSCSDTDAERAAEERRQEDADGNGIEACRSCGGIVANDEGKCVRCCGGDK